MNFDQFKVHVLQMSSTDTVASSKNNNINADKTPATYIFQSDFMCIGRLTFQRKNAKTKVIEKFDASVYVIRLNKLLKNENTTKSSRDLMRKNLKIDRIRDLLHSIVALYDNSLPDIGAQFIYDCICDRKAYSIIVLKDDNEENNENELKQEDQSDYDEENDCLDAIESEAPKSVFADLFGDSDKSENNDESSEEEGGEKLTVGIKSFIDKYKQNKEDKSKTNNIRAHIVKRLLACATVERINTFQYPGQDEWVIVLQLMAVNKNYRGSGIGKYLINMIQNTEYVGTYDAILTSSDKDAIEFYEKYGFCDNPILSSKYSSIGDIWTNTTKMCYIPPYMKTRSKPLSSKSTASSNTSELDALDELTNMENDYKKWNKIMFSAYHYNAQIFGKMKQEIICLKAKVCAQENVINDLQIKNEILERKNRLFKLQLNRRVKYTPDDEAASEENVGYEEENYDDDSSNNYEDKELNELLNELKSLTNTDQNKNQNEKYKNKIRNSFLKALKNETLEDKIEIKEIKFATKLNSEYSNNYHKLKNELLELNTNSANEKSASVNTNADLSKYTMISEMYVCGINTKNDDIDQLYDDILKNGFSEEHLLIDSYGKGIYLSHYASVDQKCEDDCQVLLVEAILGNCETVVKQDTKRKSPSSIEYNSIITPGRCKLTTATNESSFKSKASNFKEQEYVLFNHKQLLPIALIKYGYRNQ